MEYNVSALYYELYRANLMYGDGVLDDIITNNDTQALKQALKGELLEYKGIEFISIPKDEEGVYT